MTIPFGRLRRFAIDLACIACGREDELLLVHLTDLPTLPRRCSRCGGSQVATAASVKLIPDPDWQFDWADDEPDGERPLKHLRTFQEILGGPCPPDSPAYKLGASVRVGLHKARV